ncbi:uncharacterized protein Z518_10918 [Rhinocladiella mackenziei CBS 650.93]|uniref:Uncharacterized protein n=1 Tax=Rhinocladiella mackenziei CBS 650.93 TaxID=1442369 RepID=A0A0D2I9S2_9EURO|nr:uncharacterized protein Z518_10918 [Rhinocladiella mackenziei CBS 650.93]KIW99990.1 hypothetical protein Z518_10918 [Rhinocladiella mackenziei CBS 650.93]
MAEQRAQDVVNQTQSVGDLSPSDAPAATSTPDIKASGDDGGVVEAAPKENGIHIPSNPKMEEIDDGSTRSDTDTSRAEGSIAGDKSAEPKPLKKLAAKPVSFAKYAVPKPNATTNAAKGTEKALVTTPNSSTSSLAQAGRPRLVAKTTGSLQSKSKPNTSATPDPMQVWNKNRVTPQPSTKHLTDEELKQQYGIHLTSRIQADGEGKEAKWADIDDDEDDWAPETIEWNDGTKSILPPADAAHQSTQKSATPSETTEKAKPPAPSKILTPPFTSSVGPNATVLKLGASAERQQAQKVANLHSKSPAEKPSLTSSKTTPAPAPAKSPWATLPPVDKVSPVAINPPTSMPPPSRFPPNNVYGQSPSTLTAPSPAKEISADDFNRSWRDSLPSQPRELYMPNSGRYEAVAEGRRRMSKHEPNFRAPAVLQRPNQTDMHAPAEPSAAFQTHRTSTDHARRRASSTISGGSGQFGRRMSIKSNETPTPVFESHRHDVDAAIRPSSRDGPASQTQTPTYQARGMNDYISAGASSATDADIEAQRAQQRALMKENIERARRRKIEEEQRMEAEKQERIRLKLASLGPDPNPAKKKAGDATQERETKDAEQPSTSSAPVTGTTTQSPPKPPQPLPSGEPQQYGMMKVFPVDTVKKSGASTSRSMDSQRVPVRVKIDQPSSEEAQPEATPVPSPIINGVRAVPDLRRTSGQEPTVGPEPSPKLPKPSSVGNDARSGWADIRHDHRSPQTANLWGLPHNKALGNGTFDSGLAGYAPQDLSRTSSTAQGWMNGRTPHAGRSPQTQYVNHSLPDTRSYSYQSITSPDQGPLAADSEADSLFPTTKHAPIAPPQSQPVHPTTNGFQNGSRSNGVDAWTHFHQAASQQERAENERFHRELMARREEELRTGVRQGPQYTFNETWKQAHVGDQAGQRQVTNISQSTVPASNVFGAVGSLPGTDLGPRIMNGPSSRGSRFFPQPLGVPPPQDRRAFTYSHPEPPRTPSPPPAEDYASFHPAFDGDTARPVVHFPREKAVVKLPPAMPPTPPSPVQAQAAPAADTPMTWAARVSMPPSTSAPSLRAISTPIAQNASWQERFNGLLGKKSSPTREVAQPVHAVLAVTSSTREPLEVPHVVIPAASVSLPLEGEVGFLVGDESVTTKDVESEDDLFEDRELGSLPAVSFPLEAPIIPWAPMFGSRMAPQPVEATSAYPFMVSNFNERHGPSKPQYALVRFPGTNKPIKRDLPVKGPTLSNGGKQRFGSGPSSSSGSYAGKNPRNRAGPRSRQASKAH